jgi:hypothetical protein
MKITKSSKLPLLQEAVSQSQTEGERMTANKPKISSFAKFVAI